MRRSSHAPRVRLNSVAVWELLDRLGISQEAAGSGRLPGGGWRFASQKGIITGIFGTGPYRPVLANTGFRPNLFHRF